MNDLLSFSTNFTYKCMFLSKPATGTVQNLRGTEGLYERKKVSKVYLRKILKIFMQGNVRLERGATQVLLKEFVKVLLIQHLN